MARSGSTDFTITANDIIKKALALVAERAAEIPLTNSEITDGLQSLNILVKAWQGQGFHLWKRDEGVLFLRPGITRYKLGATGDHACLEDDFIKTEVATAAIALDDTLVVDSATGMLGATDIYAVNQATLVGSWTATSATIAVASSKLTITNSGAAAGYAEVSLTGLTVGEEYRVTYGYEVGTSTSATFSVISDSVVLATATLSSTDAAVTMDFTATQTTGTFRAANVSTTSGHTTLVTAMNYVNQLTGDSIGIELDDGTRQWLDIVSISGSTLSLKDQITSAAAVDNTVFTYSNIIGRPLRIEDARRTTDAESSEIEMNKWSRQEYFSQVNKTSQGSPTNFYYQPKLENGEVHIWQTADNVNQLVKFTFEKTIEDFDSTANNPDFPIEWSRALIWNLALDIGPEYSTPEPKLNRIERKAAEYLDNMLGWDEEVSSINIQPSFKRG